MAHTATHICTPENIYGPFEQTMFLGLTVISFTANAGVNEQSSDLTIELVQDLCAQEPPPGFDPQNPVPYGKVYFKTEARGDFSKYYYAGPDPGFTEPAPGAPCYFRVANFEYSGIMQSWNKKNGPDGNPVYTVKLTDPRILLDNVQVIVGEYQGGIQGVPSSPDRPPVSLTHQLGNIVNAYGFLDALNQNCPFVEVGHPSDDPENKASFGSPAGGWGTSSDIAAGVPWNYLKRAVQCLLGNSAQANAPKFSKGYILGPPGAPRTAATRGGFGELYTGGGIGNLNTPAAYIIDLSEIPDAPAFYRVSGPVISTSEMIAQVCRDAGCDYYIELLPTARALVIKVRVILRTNQPAMGEITAFINTAASQGGATSSTIGREYRPNPNNAFIIGDKKRSVYRHSGTILGGDATIQPYWGRDLDGKLNLSYQSSCETRDTTNANHWVGPPDWNIRLDFRDINGQLNHKMTTELRPDGTPYTAYHKLLPDGRGWVWEGELRAAMGSLNSFVNFLLLGNTYPTGCVSPAGDKTVLKLWAEDINLAFQGQVQLAVTPSGGSGNPVVAPNASFLSSINTMNMTRGPVGPTDPYLKDAQKVHQWLQQYAQEHYGRKWLVEIPFACYAGDTGNPDLIRWSDEPSTEGAWTEANNVLDLEHFGVGQGVAMDRFKTSDGRLNPILRWTQNAPHADPCTRQPCVTGLDYDQVPVSNLLTNTYDTAQGSGADLYVWQKADISEKWVTGCPYLDSDQDRVFALLTCDPVYTGFPANDGKRTQETFMVQSGMRDKPVVFSTLKQPMVGLGGSYASRMLPPLAAAVPVVSNTQTYGPWWKEAVPHNASMTYGTVHAEQDTTLSPWEYGGTDFMNVGALSKVENATTAMNVAERGEVTVGGYPTKGLGAAISSSLTLAPARNLVTAVFFGLNYQYVTLVASAAGASISNMNVVVSPQGVTTSYTISTFTPVFGRFSKGNADRIKAIGRNKLAADRARRGKTAKDAIRQMNASGRGHTLLSRMMAGPAYSPSSAGVILAGRLFGQDEKRKEVLVADKNTFAFYDDYENTAMMSMDGLIRPVAKTGAAIPWTNGGLPAMKSHQSGLCPGAGISGLLGIDWSGRGSWRTGTGIPQATGAYSGFDTGNVKYENVGGVLSPPPPLGGMTGIIIAANYLDPLADPVSNATFLSGVRSTGSLHSSGTSGSPLYPYASGHDIESVARGDARGLEEIGNSTFTGQSMIIGGMNDRYAAGIGGTGTLPVSDSGRGDYRFMALRGPLVLQSWGYDTYGKPVPNSRGYSGDATFQTGAYGLWDTSKVADTGNVHQKGQSGLTDRFAPNWLSDATNWPVAPVDLRYDRARGVWTAPPPYRLMKVKAIESIPAGSTGLVEVLSGGDMYDKDGVGFADIVTVQPTGLSSGASGQPIGTGLQTGIPPLINLDNFLGSDIEKDDILVTHYDTYSCQHWPLGGGGGGGGDGGCKGGMTQGVRYVDDVVCVGDILEVEYKHMNFLSGCFMGTST